MDQEDDSELLESVLEVCASSSLPTGDVLAVLQFAWIALAGVARNEALAFPDGFPAERERQARQLEAMASTVREDVPDLESERLLQEGDVDGWLKHIRNASETDAGHKAP